MWADLMMLGKGKTERGARGAHEGKRQSADRRCPLAKVPK